MTHPIIETLREEPYKFTIEQPDESDNETYLYRCSEDLRLKIHVEKPASMWSGINENKKRVERKNFPEEASKEALKFSRAFNIVKMELKSETPEQTPDFKSFKTVASAKSQGEAQGRSKKPETKQTSLIPTESQPVPCKSTTLSFTEEQMKAMMGTVAKGANEAEFTMLMHLAEYYGLDPFLHEIYYVSQMKTIMTSRDGYLKIAQNHPAFKGIHSMAVHENDDFEIDVAQHTVHHKFGKGERGKLIGAWAIVYREGRFPVIAYADISEYKGSSQPWQKYPSAMICKCAEAFALKRQFGISGLVTKEEMDYHVEGDPEIVDAEYVNMDAIDADYTVQVD